MNRGLTLTGLVLGLVLLAGMAGHFSTAAGPEAPPPTNRGEAGAGSLTVVNAGKTMVLSAERFAKLPRQTVKARDHSGTLASYEGVYLADLLRDAGVMLGKDLKGPRLAEYVLVRAADGYRVVFSLPEIDPDMTDQLVLVADRKDGKSLAAREGPYRLVVPHDKRFARWVRQVVEIGIHRPDEAGRQAPRP